jgi:Domain of unknown function (DUF4382)
MYRKWTFKYSLAAVIVAIAIISVSLVGNLNNTPLIPEAQAKVVILLTDPPTVPAGTTQLNLTYTDISLHVAYQNGTQEWIPVDASGTVNLFSLVNVTQTIASATLPINSTVDKVQFTIANVSAVINSQTHNVTSLSDTFVVRIANGAINQTLTGVLIDFNPTLVQIQAQDANDTTIYYYVLVPSANAMIVNDITSEHAKVGTIVKIGENNKVQLVRVKEDFSKNLTIVSATLTVNGNTTGLSVTLKNEGNVTFRVFGLTLHGEFNAAQSLKTKTTGHDKDEHMTKVHPETIPFKLSGTSLIPVYGTADERVDPFSSVTIQPSETLTLNFNDVIEFYTGKDHNQNPKFTITPIVNETYTLRLMGEGYQTLAVEATSLP